MPRKVSMAEQARQRFLRSNRASRHEPREDPGAGSGVQVAAVPVKPRPTALEQDAALVALEAGPFAREDARIQGEPIQQPVGPHLHAITAIAWLFTIDPVFTALTPRNFQGIPAYQLLALFFVLCVMIVFTLWIWARWIPAPLRVVLRTQLSYWKRWLGIGFVAFLASQHLG